MKVFKISHLVKSEDLNHHGTLFAGRTAEWLVEAGFVTAAAEHGRPQAVRMWKGSSHSYVSNRTRRKSVRITSNWMKRKIRKSLSFANEPCMYNKKS